MGREDMREVPLVDEDGTGDGTDDGPPLGRGRRFATRPSAPAGPRRRTRGLPTTATALAVLAVVLGIAVVGAVGAQRERAHAARVAALPGVLAPVDPSMTVRWTLGRARLVGATREGDLLASLAADGGGRALLRLGAVDGRERWRAALPEVEDTGDVSCTPVEDGGRTTLVACRLVTAVDLLAAGLRQPRPGAGCLLVVLDAATGERVAERDLGGRWTEITSLGRDLVRVEMLPDRRVQVLREDPVTGRATWTARSAWSVRRPGSPTAPMPVPVPAVKDGVVVVEGAVALALSPDGVPLGEWHLSRSYEGPSVVTVELTPLPGGLFAVWEPMAGPPTGAVTSGLGGRERHFLGSAVEPVVDDGSGPEDLLLTRTAADLLALDARTGRLLWRAEEAFTGEDVLVLDGRVITMAQAGLIAVDATSGRRLWRADVRVPGARQRLVTDGRVVLLPTEGRDGGPRLVAVGPDDGRERWSVAAPDEVVDVHVAAGRLVLRTGSGLTGLG